MTLFTFSRRRWWVFGGILGFLGFVISGAILMNFVPAPISTAMFIAYLMFWFIPSILFEWTGFFELHEFGGSPNGWEGYLIVVLFYVALAFLISWPFAGRKKPKDQPDQD